MNALGLVAAREMRETVRRRSFWVISAIFLLGATAAVVLPEVLSGGGGGTDTVATVDAPEGFTDALGRARAADDTNVEFVAAGDAADLRRRVDDGDVDLGVLGGDDPEIVVRSGEHDALVGAAQQALVSSELETRLGDAGLSDDEVRGALDIAPARVDGIDEGADARRGASVIAATVLYLLLLTLTISVANGVAIEKANRISEVLLAIVPPRALLLGKVIGVGVMGIATLMFGLAPIAIRYAAGGDLPEGIGGVLAAGAAWFALGLAFYLVVSGSLAALVERQEQAGSAMGPLMVALIGALLVAQSAPESPLAVVLAYVPFSSPVVEPARIAVGASSPTEIALSLAILVVSVVLALRFGGLVYQRAIVRTGRKLTLTEVLRTAQ